MNKTVISLAALASLATLLVCPTWADTGFTDPQPDVNGAPGLLVTVFHRGLDHSLASPPSIFNIYGVSQYANTNSPDYAFINTRINSTDSLNYGGATDSVSTNLFLGGDAAGAALGDKTSLNSTIIDQRGYIYLPVAGTYTFRMNAADDAAAVYIGGNGASGTGNQLIVRNFDSSINGASGVPSPVNVDIFPNNADGTPAPVGWYPFEVIYFNQYNPNNNGYAGLNFSVTGPGTPQFRAFNVTSPIPLHRYGFAADATDIAPADARNGTLVGGATVAGGALSTTGPTGQAAQLNTNVTSFFFGSFTVEQWFTRKDTVANFQTLFSFGTDTAHYLIAHPARGGSGLLSADFNNGTGEVSLTAPAPDQGVETLLTVTFDGSTNTASLYLNGHLTSSKTVPGGFNLANTAQTNFSGINGLSPWGDPSLNGTTNEFRMYRQPLTQAQVIQHFVNGPSRTTHP